MHFMLHELIPDNFNIIFGPFNCCLINLEYLEQFY